MLLWVRHAGRSTRKKRSGEGAGTTEGATENPAEPAPSIPQKEADLYSPCSKQNMHSRKRAWLGRRIYMLRAAGTPMQREHSVDRSYSFCLFVCLVSFGEVCLFICLLFCGLWWGWVFLVWESFCFCFLTMETKTHLK